MIIKVKLFVSSLDQPAVYETELDIPDDKLELLEEEEISAAIDTNVRTWAERNLFVDWEVIEHE